MEPALNYTGTGRVGTTAGYPMPQPGDLCVVHGFGFVDRKIRAAEYLADGRRSPWNHVCVASRYLDGTLLIVEAQPGGAVEVPWHYARQMHRWSTGVLPDCPDAGPAAQKYAKRWEDPDGHGVPYSFLDYGAIALHTWHIPAPGLQEFIADTGHMICSQLADQARYDAGSHLFADGRWPGYVKPSDIGFLLS